MWCIGIGNRWAAQHETFIILRIEETLPLWAYIWGFLCAGKRYGDMSLESSIWRWHLWSLVQVNTPIQQMINSINLSLDLKKIIWWNTSYSAWSQSDCLQRQDRCQWDRMRLYLQFILYSKGGKLAFQKNAKQRMREGRLPTRCCVNPDTQAFCNLKIWVYHVMKSKMLRFNDLMATWNLEHESPNWPAEYSLTCPLSATQSKS